MSSDPWRRMFRVWRLAALALLTLIACLSRGYAQPISPDLYSRLKYRYIGPVGNRVIAVTGVRGNPTLAARVSFWTPFDFRGGIDAQGESCRVWPSGSQLTSTPQRRQDPRRRSPHWRPGPTSVKRVNAPASTSRESSQAFVTSAGRSPRKWSRCYSSSTISGSRRGRIWLASTRTWRGSKPAGRIDRKPNAAETTPGHLRLGPTGVPPDGLTSASGARCRPA